MNNFSSKYEWNIYRAILYGFICGILFSFYSIYQEITTNDALNFYEIINTRGVVFYTLLGEIVGGVVGGAFLFGVVAKIRNLFIKSL